MAGRDRAALGGILAAAGALAAGEALASIARGVPSPVLSVARVVIDLAPAAVREPAIETLGTSDKPALLLGVLVLSALVGAGAGVLSRRRPAAGAAVIAVFGLLGLLAAQTDPRATLLGGVVAAVVGVVTGVLLLRWLVDGAEPPRVEPQAAADGARRSFLWRGTATAVGVAVGGAVVTARSRRTAAGTPGAAPAALPPPADPLPTVPAAASLDVPGITPLVTPSSDLYRIDTALVVPRVDPRRWTLRVEGMVDRPARLGLTDLYGMEQVELDCTIACVSNEVGGDLVGTVRWQGVPLRSLLDAAGVRSGATQVVGESVDGFTAGFPIEAATDDRRALVALGIGGEPLPAKHGFPARLVVPGLYGYVSATKWLSRIRVNRLEDEDGYWIPRGWSKLGPVKTQCRIDVPGARRIPAGPTAVAGVAWAPTRGISRVEVQVDDGPWQDARLGDGLGPLAWRQWVWTWDARPGSHTIRARATDGTGAVQTDVRTPVAPDGATGYPVRRIAVD